MNDLERFANILGCARIDNIENIAKNTAASTKEDYIKEFAENIVKAKFESAGLKCVDTGEIKWTSFSNENYLIMIFPEKILAENKKEGLKRHAHKVRRIMDDNSLSGTIYFMPFLMNDVMARTILKRELPIGFVNLPYDGRALERRVNTYLR